MSFHVPTVDIGSWVAGGSDSARTATARAIDEACRTIGFIQITGHGIAPEVITGLTTAMDEFFALPLETKSTFRSGGNRGYTPPKAESLSLSLGVESASRMNDFFEAFNVGAGASAYPHVSLSPAEYAENVWPDVADYRVRIEAYFAEARRVAETLTSIFEEALELAPGYFDAFTDHSIDVLRMNNYALPPGTVDLDGELTGMGQHTDYGIVTVLWADQVAGLQVLGHDGSWNDVQPAAGALLVNLGDLTARWTNERWLSTLHRVKPPIVDGTIERRRSAAYFHDGNADALISTLPGCVDDAHPDLYSPVTVGEHIAAKLAGSRAGVANTAATREAARALGSRAG